MNVDNKGKNILILGEGPTQGLDDTSLTAEAKYPKFTQSGKIFVVSLHYNRSNSSYLLMLQKYINSKQNTQNKRLCTVFR